MSKIVTLKQIKGDASYRNFFRKKKNFFTSIIVIAKKEKFKNLLVYEAINKLLNKNKVLAPKLYKESYDKNFLEIQDFGNDTIFKILLKEKNKQYFYLKKIIEVLVKLQTIKNRRIKNFRKKIYIIPNYDKKILIKEANLFCDWYVKENLPKKNRDRFIKSFKQVIIKLIFNLKLKNDVLVHRDFHVSNLMLVKDKIGVIDSQDALIGNKAYDLASLIDDVRIKTPRSLKDKVYKLYVSKHVKLDKYKFKNDFEILSVLRNFKIIGIFTRLAKRDNKKNYLKLIPNAWSLINMRINENKVFLDLKKLLKASFKKKLYEN